MTNCGGKIQQNIHTKPLCMTYSSVLQGKGNVMNLGTKFLFFILSHDYLMLSIMLPLSITSLMILLACMNV